MKDIKAFLTKFLTLYNTSFEDQIWTQLSEKFRNFWYHRIVQWNGELLTDDEIDEIVRILDQNGKGNTKQDEAIARVMVPQVAWRNMFREFSSNKVLSSLMTNIMEESSDDKKIEHIEKLYIINKTKYLTGPSGSAINAFLAAFDPLSNLSIVSVKDRKKLIEYFELPASNFEQASPGYQFIKSNQIIIRGFQDMGVSFSARTIACFCYDDIFKPEWRDDIIVKKPGNSITVTVPSDQNEEEPKKSTIIQATLAKIGSKMGFSIWLPKADRCRVLKYWSPKPEELLEILPLSYDKVVMKTIENIDVLWIEKRTIKRAFEVEHTTSIYSGLLRMADLLALIPNISLNLHIVAPNERRDKVFEEIKRPVFSLLFEKPLSEMCSFLSYDSVTELCEAKYLSNMAHWVLDEIAETAE